MKKTGLAILAVAAALLVASGPLVAHHSLSQYDTKNPVTFTATVTGFDFVNPHVAIHFEVKDESGNVEKWIALTAPPQRLYRAGWTTKTLKIGDQITITGAPHKEGAKAMGLVKLVGPSGQVLTQGAE